LAIYAGFDQAQFAARGTGSLIIGLSRTTTKRLARRVKAAATALKYLSGLRLDKMPAREFRERRMALTEGEKSALIQESGLFDPRYYLERNHDVATSPHQPFFHYVNWGAEENRNPSDRFDAAFYRSQCAMRGVIPGNCIVHYLTQGHAQGLFATPLDCALKLTGVPLIDLVQQFESFGRDCEFGLFQKWLGAEPNDLFRFSNPTPELLTRLIHSDFAGYGEQSRVELDEQRPRREWFVVDVPSGVSRHTRIFEGDMSADKVLKTAAIWTRLLRTKTVRDLAGGQKIYVIKTSQADLDKGSVMALAKAIRSKGAGWLLWVEAGTPVGHCEVAADGLIRGRKDRLCVRSEENNFSLAGWIKVLCSAWNTVQS
jgi:hypothetical protein